MKRLCFLLGALFFIGSCSTLPVVLHPERLMLPEGPPQCRRPIIAGRWQFQYVIEAAFPEEQESVLIGVTIVSAETGSIHSILMTLEGMVVFDARYEREIRILRAFRPFGSERFARDLLHDIRLVFFKPQGALLEAGTLADGSCVCRYQQPGGQVVDIIRNADHHWQVQQHGHWLTQKRTVDIFFNDKFRFDGFQAPSRLKLKAAGYAGYTLDMELVEAISLEDYK